MPVIIDSELQAKAQDEVKKLFEKAVNTDLLTPYRNKLYKPSLAFNQRGKIAGSARMRENEIRINPTLFFHNQSYFFNQVIPHELAHIFVFQIFKNTVKPHGSEWRQIMLEVFDIPPLVTHNLDTSVLGYDSYTYKCACQSIELSKTRHNKVLAKKQEYRCKKCKETLIHFNN